MLRRCPNYGFDELTPIHIFHSGIQPQPKFLLDGTANVSLISKSAEDAISIIDRMALNDHRVQHSRGHS